MMAYSKILGAYVEVVPRAINPDPPANSEVWCLQRKAVACGMTGIGYSRLIGGDARKLTRSQLAELEACLDGVIEHDGLQRELAAVTYDPVALGRLLDK